MLVQGFFFLRGGGCFKPKGFSQVSIFAPIRSSVSLEIRSTPPCDAARCFFFLLFFFVFLFFTVPQNVTRTKNEHEERENEKWEQTPTFNPSPLSNLVSKSLFFSHFSFSHPPLLVPCSPFPVLVTSQCFTVTCDQSVTLPNFTFYGGLEHITTILFCFFLISKLIYNSLEFKPYEYWPTLLFIKEKRK